MNVSYSRYQDPSPHSRSQDPSPTGNLSQDVQRFSSNVSQLEAKVRQLQVEQDDARLKGDIIQLLSSCARLAKSIDATLKEMKEQRDVSKDFEYKRYLSVFQTSFSTFQALQKATTGIEQTQLKLARAESVRRSRHISAAAKEDSKLLLHPTEQQQQGQTFASNELADLQERERVVSQLEHDILDMNEIFRDLATMVHEQGETIEQIEVHVEGAAINVQQANKQLGQASQYKSSNRKLKICIAVIVIGAILVVVIVIVIILAVLGVFKK